MMGAGEFPAGVCPAGLDAQQTQAPSTATAYPRAMQFDPGTRQFVQNADGSMADIHPVDQAVALLLGIEAGSVPSDATFGHKLRKLLSRVPPSKVSTIAQQEVARVLAPLVSNGDVEIVSVQAQCSSLGRTLVAVTYRNLRLPGSKPRTVNA